MTHSDTRKRYEAVRDARKRSTGKPGPLAWLFATLFFGLFAAAGLFFFYLLASETLERVGTWSWERTPCVIHSIKIVEDRQNDESDPYRLSVDYEYEFDARSYRSRRWTIGGGNTANYGKLHRETLERRAGSESYCYVDPDAPHHAVLALPSLWVALFLPLPVVFIVIGGAGMWGTWFGATKKPDAVSHDKGPISRTNRRGLRWVLVILLAGLGLASVYAGRALGEQALASSREQIECRIVHSRLMHQESSEGGTTYALDILYEFELDGIVYRSNRYDTLTYVFSSGRSGKYDILKRFPAGSQATCYVDPDRPYRALLSASLRPLHAILLIPFGGFLIVGWILRRVARGPRVHRAASATPQPTGPLVLRPEHSQGKRVFGLFAFTVIWLGFCAFLLYQSQSSGGVALYLITGAFCFFGLLLLIGLARSFLSLFNPRIELELFASQLARGESTGLRWSFARGSERIEQLTIQLEGREEAVYRRGTDTITDRHVFAEIPIASVARGPGVQRGDTRFELPADAMHSFRSRHNRIVWEIKVKGEIAKWPDIDEAFPVIVAPNYQAP